MPGDEKKPEGPGKPEDEFGDFMADLASFLSTTPEAPVEGPPGGSGQAQPSAATAPPEIQTPPVPRRPEDKGPVVPVTSLEEDAAPTVISDERPTFDDPDTKRPPAPAAASLSIPTPLVPIAPQKLASMVEPSTTSSATPPGPPASRDEEEEIEDGEEAGGLTLMYDVPSEVLLRAARGHSSRPPESAESRTATTSAESTPRPEAAAPRAPKPPPPAVPSPPVPSPKATPAGDLVQASKLAAPAADDVPGPVPLPLGPLSGAGPEASPLVLAPAHPRRGLLLVLVAILAVAGAGAVFWLTRSPGPSSPSAPTTPAAAPN